MAYDYAGSWDSVSGHQANIYSSGDASTPFSTNAAVDYYVGHGVASKKIVLGMPLYGRAFENNDGLGKPFQGVGEGTWENGVFDYKKLPLEGSDERYDDKAQATYCYSAANRKLVSYDTAPMAKTKAEYVKAKSLGGAMWWESSGDKSGSESLISTVVDGFGGASCLQKQDNCISYPETKYDNLRDKFPNN
jgi:chitinase